MPPRKIKVVDVINPEGYACDDNVLPEAIEDIDPSDKPIEKQTPQPVEEEVTQPVSNIKTVELVECPDCKLRNFQARVSYQLKKKQQKKKKNQKQRKKKNK